VELRIRDARDEDAPGLSALMGAGSAEYPGCVLDANGERPERRRAPGLKRDAPPSCLVSYRDPRLLPRSAASGSSAALAGEA
jgi:hypothetical protein